MDKERHQKEKETRVPNKVFYLLRDHYSNPEVLIFVAPDRKSALEMLHEKLTSENSLTDIYDKDLHELDLKHREIITLSPPGDRHFIR